MVDTSPRTIEIDREFGRVLTQPRFQDSLFLAAKINTEGEEAGIAQMRQSQRFFGRPTLDLLQVESLRDLDVHCPNVRAWKDSGGRTPCRRNGQRSDRTDHRHRGASGRSASVEPSQWAQA